jgi:hypothetical protein
VLQNFSELSGLFANPNKSSLYCTRVTQLVKEKLIDCLQIKEGKLSIRYLGVPLISKKLTAADYAILIEKIIARIDSWLSKKLSFAGRLHLLSSMLYGIQVYWSSIS